MIYLKSVEFLEDVNPLLKGFKVEFNKSITALVGDNGVGKSTITDAINQKFGVEDFTYLKRHTSESIKLDKVSTEFNFKGIDFHGDDRKFSASFGGDYCLQIRQMKLSSGQVTISLLNQLATFENGVLVLDEPERGMSLRNQWKIGRLIANISKMKKVQVICTTHSEPILLSIKNSAQIYSVEHKKDMEYKDYMLDQLNFE